MRKSSSAAIGADGLAAAVRSFAAGIARRDIVEVGRQDFSHIFTCGNQLFVFGASRPRLEGSDDRTLVRGVRLAGVQGQVFALWYPVAAA